MHYRYDAIKSEPSDRREQAFGKSLSESKTGSSPNGIALGKPDGRPELGISIPPEKTLAKNIANLEKAEAAADLFKIAADIFALVKATDKETATAKLQKDTVELIIKGFLEVGVAAQGEAILERTPGKVGPMVEYGGKKGADAFFANEIEMINDGVTALRHAVIRGDLTEIREISYHARRVTLDLALYLYFQNSFLHPISSRR
jgi:hypothetical protein